MQMRSAAPKLFGRRPPVSRFSGDPLPGGEPGSESQIVLVEPGEAGLGDLSPAAVDGQ
jgi:hypothetical protein